MENKLFKFVLLTILINKSFQSPVNGQLKNIDSNNAESLEITVPQGWELESFTQKYDDLSSEDSKLNTGNEFQTEAQFRGGFSEFVRNLNEETTERLREETTDTPSETTTIDFAHPCGPLIVNLDQNNYNLDRGKASPILCNAYFAKHTSSRCNDGSVYYAKFDLKINGILLIEEFMKRVFMSYDGFYSKFIISELVLESIPYFADNPSIFKASCDVTITTSAGSAFNQSLESEISVDKKYPLDSNYETTEIPYPKMFSNDGYSTQYNGENELSTDMTGVISIDSCKPRNVRIYRSEPGYTHNGNTAILCRNVIPTKCFRNSLFRARYELMIDGTEMTEKYITTSLIWFDQFYIEFVIQNSVIEKLSKMHSELNAYCHVTIELGTEQISSSSSSINIGARDSASTLIPDNGSPLNGSCSYPRECKADRNLTCDWDQKCHCKYDDGLGAYYVPYKQSNEWYCARPAKHNQQCFHTNQCKQLNKGSVCTQTSIGKICECDQMFYWNGFKCVSVDESDVETTTSYYSFTYRFHTQYSYTAIAGVSLAALLGGYLFIVLALHLYLKNKKKQLNKEQSVNRVFSKKRFIPHIFMTGKTEDKKEILKDDKIATIRVVE